jgi:hypothetical protein
MAIISHPVLVAVSAPDIATDIPGNPVADRPAAATVLAVMKADGLDAGRDEC